MTTAPKPIPPWLFLLTGMPYGVVGSFAGTVMPYLTRRAGVSVDAIGWYGALLLVPPMIQFLYAPIVDIGPKRKHWLLIVAILGGACLTVACTMPLPGSITWFLAFAAVGQLVSGLVGSCNGGLLAVAMPNEKRGAAAGWLNIGNLSGGGLSAWVVISMTSHEVAPLYIGLTIAAMMIAPALAVLWVDEPERSSEAAQGGAGFRIMLSEVRAILTSKSGLTGFLLCLSPVGTAALANFFSGMAVDYHASDKLIAFVSGPANVILTAIGALVGGYLCDRGNRRALYLLSGALTAVCGLVMMLSPRTPMTYQWGVMAYALITGFCYSTFTATVLETIGNSRAGASTRYALFVAAGNAAIAYVGLIDTRFHKGYGVEGVVGADAGLNILGVVLLGAIFWRLGLLSRRRDPLPKLT